jgi:hypothetical protein
MEQSSSWQANSHSPRQEIPHLLWKPNVSYRVHKGPPLLPILSQMNPFHTFTSNYPKIHSNIILLCTPWSSDLSLPFTVFNENIISISHLSHACYMSHPVHPSRFDHPNNIWRSVHVIKLLIMQSSPASRQFLSLSFRYSPLRPVIRHPQSVILC